MRMYRLQKGFTLIELLIVIAIIGILSTLLMANFIGIRQRARDAQRKSDLQQLRSALEMWRADNGVYPVALANPLQNNGVTYMAKVPTESLGSWPAYAYTPGNGNSTYQLTACLENANDADAKGGIPCGTANAGITYTLTQP